MSNSGNNVKGKKNNKPMPELLAPAGSKEAFIAAVEAGADAIYCGGKLFNARMSADNFDMDEMAEAVAFAHKRLVKVYVTVNTLIKDEEMADALSYAEKLWEIGVDALILQDIGLAYLVRKALPDFPIHLSTQGTVYNLDGVRSAAKLGFSRVVLARELSLDEISSITKGIEDENKVEIEVFCHGALCYCYSGQCQMSRAIGGRSANRGACAQPCRMKYEEGFALSPKDLSSIDYLAEFRDAGVRSLKIEGRMKSPEYVATVVSIYRKYLDLLYTNGSYEVSSEDRKKLTQAFSRGFTDLNLTGNEDIEDIMSGASPKNKGLEVGSILSQKSIGKKNGKNDRYYLDAELTESVSLGDILEVEGYPDSSFTLTYLEKVGSHYRLGDIRTLVKSGSKINRLISAQLNKDASTYFKSKEWIGSKYIRKVPLEIDVIGTIFGNVDSEGVPSGSIKVSFKEPKTGTISKIELTGIEIGPEGADCRERIISSLGKLGGSSFDAARIRTHGEFGFVLPVKEINALRREGVSQLEEKLVGRRSGVNIEKVDIEEVLKLIKGFDEAGEAQADYQPEIYIPELYIYEIPDENQRSEELDALADVLEILRRIKERQDEMDANVITPAVLFPAAEIDKINCGLKELADRYKVPLIPYVSNVSKGKEDELIRANLERIKVFCREHRVPIYLGNLSQIELFGSFNDADVELRYDFGINVFNKWGVAAARSLGLKEGVMSLEVEDGHYGAKPLMIIEHDNSLNEIKDMRGRRYVLVKPVYSDQMRLVKDPVDVAKDVSEVLGENRKGLIRYYFPPLRKDKR